MRLGYEEDAFDKAYTRRCVTFGGGGGGRKQSNQMEMRVTAHIYALRELP